MEEKNKISDDHIVHFDEEHETSNILEDTFVNLSNGFDCNECYFLAKTEAGLKTHQKKKHRKQKN